MTGDRAVTARLRTWRALTALAVLAAAACGSLTAQRSVNVERSTQRGSAEAAPTTTLRHLIYAAQDDGMVKVYDIDAGHRLVQTIPVFPCCADVRGAAAAAPSHRFYVMYDRANQGHVASIDLLSARVVWDKVLHAPGVDRGNLTPDGTTLYLPTGERDPSSPYELVVDALTGTVLSSIPLPLGSHDTVVSLDGSRVFMETKSAAATMYIATTGTNTVVETIPGYCCGGVLGPFSVNGRGTLMVNDVVSFNGFQIADLTTGHVIASVPVASTPSAPGHGIAFTPDERQVWVNDGATPYVHVFDMTSVPLPPRHVADVRVGNASPHWVTFDIAGRFAYVAGRKGSGDPTDVIDAHTYRRVGILSASEDLIEVDIGPAGVTAVGNQFGLGRETSPQASSSVHSTVPAGSRLGPHGIQVGPPWPPSLQRMEVSVGRRDQTPAATRT